MKRVAADQSIIDQAIALQAQGKTDAEIARELGVGPGTPSNWRKQGRLPEKPQRKTNGGKVREYEPLPELKPGQRLDGTPEPKKEETPRMIEVEKAQVAEPFEVKEPVGLVNLGKPVNRPPFQPPAAEKKSRITRSMRFKGEYVDMSIETGEESDLTITLPGSIPGGLQNLAQLLMDLEAEVHELIVEVEKLL